MWNEWARTEEKVDKEGGQGGQARWASWTRKVGRVDKEGGQGGRGRRGRRQGLCKSVGRVDKVEE
eukprot:5520211-Alexandrium_andersonii.AAC.1